MKLKNKRGVSAVVATVILVGLAVVITGSVWIVVNNLVSENLDEAGSCFGILDQVMLNDRFTCYDSANQDLVFSISIGDIEVEEVLVGVAAGGSGESFKITNTPGTIPNVARYPGGETSDVVLPGKNSGRTYIFDLGGAPLPTPPTSVEIAPVVGGNQCSVSSSIRELEDCSIVLS